MGFKKVNVASPCVICDEPTLCSIHERRYVAICRRVKNRFARKILNADGSVSYLYQIDYIESYRSFNDCVPRPRNLARADVLNDVYNRLLDSLSISKEHASHLLGLGLSRSQIARGKYRSWKPSACPLIMNSLLAEIPSEFLNGVPGFYKNDNENFHSFAFPQSAGLLKPIRDICKRIVGLKVKTDLDSKCERYLYISSKKYGGASSGNPLHFPVFSSFDRGEVRVVEGEMKADIATCVTGVPTLSVAGGDGCNRVLRAFCHIKPTRIRIAFDRDFWGSSFGGKSLELLKIALEQKGFKPVIELWGERNVQAAK